MVELSDFPAEIQQMIVERCDFLSRFNLRSTSKSMLEIVDSTKFYIPKLEIGGSIYFLALNVTENQTSNEKKNYKIVIEIENPNSMEITAKWMGNILRNAEIEAFPVINYSPLTGQFLQKFIENLKSPLKVRRIVWIGKEFSNFFDKKYLKKVEFFKGEKSDVTGELLVVLKDVEWVFIGFPIDVTDEYVLSMNSTNIHLQSEHFTAEMINQLVDKFIARGIIGSQFKIENPKENFKSRIVIPNGFERRPRFEHDVCVYESDGVMMTLEVHETFVDLQIKDRGKIPLLPGPPEEDFDGYDDYEDDDDFDIDVYSDGGDPILDFSDLELDDDYDDDY